MYVFSAIATLTVRHVLVAPSLGNQSAFATTRALFADNEGVVSDGAPLDTFVFADSPTPALPENRTQLKPHWNVVVPPTVRDRVKVWLDAAIAVHTATRE
jgi:hypothetical protein